MKLPIEDDFNDIVSKAQKGLGISTEDLAEKTGLGVAKIRNIRKGEFDEASLRAIAQACALNEEALVANGKKAWYPNPVEEIPGFTMFSTPFAGLHVNSFVIWDVETREAVAFDTGTDESQLLDFLQQNNLKLGTLILTHTHGDHYLRYGTIRDASNCKVFVHESELTTVKQAESMREGFTLQCGCLSIRGIETPGHRVEHMSFIVDGLSKPLAVAGDAIFPGSMGAANVSYSQSLASMNRVLDLSENTVIASGHGPLSTVGEERLMNCFFTG